MKGRIFEIKRFAVHDGDGIRTTCFLKGCPLRCVWCHNPEGISALPQLAYYEEKCVHCGECVTACPTMVHSFTEGIHTLERDKCTHCGRCRDACFGDALEIYGREVTVGEILLLLLEDRAFYGKKGGVTLSGGECLLQADFCAELLKALKAEGVHTAVDTCGFVPREAIDKVMPYTDVFLYDVKAADASVHIKCTGRSNKIILENLAYIDDRGKPLEIRIPYVPGYNDGEMEGIGEILHKLKNLTKVRILPYHNYAGGKYAALSMENTLPGVLPEPAKLQMAAETLRRYVPTVYG